MTNTAFNVTSFLAVTLYQGNHDMQHKPGHVISIWRYKLKCCFFEIENSQWENWNHLFLNVGQELNQSYSIHGIFYFRLNWKEAIDTVTWIFQWEDIICTLKHWVSVWFWFILHTTYQQKKSQVKKSKIYGNVVCMRRLQKVNF